MPSRLENRDFAREDVGDAADAHAERLRRADADLNGVANTNRQGGLLGAEQPGAWFKSSGDDPDERSLFEVLLIQAEDAGRLRWSVDGR